MKWNPLTLVVSVLLFVVFVLLLFVFQVRQSEVAVVTRFGAPNRMITQAGAHGRLPWPVEKVHLFDQRVQNFEDHLTEGLTKDSFGLLTSIYVGWKVTDAKAFYPKFAGSSEPISEAEKVLERLLSNAKLAVVGKHPLADFVSATDNGTNFLAIEGEILTAVQSQVRANNYGLDIEFLGFKKLQLPEAVTANVFERMQSERKVLADKSQSEGEAEAQKIRSAADRKATELLADAEGQALQIRGQGEAKAAESLVEFQKNQDLASFIFRLNALENALKERSTLIFDQRTPPFDLFNGVSSNLTIKPN